MARCRYNIVCKAREQHYYINRKKVVGLPLLLLIGLGNVTALYDVYERVQITIEKQRPFDVYGHIKPKIKLGIFGAGNRKADKCIERPD